MLLYKTMRQVCHWNMKLFSKRQKYPPINMLVYIPPWDKEVEERAGHSYKQYHPYHGQPY